MLGSYLRPQLPATISSSTVRDMANPMRKHVAITSSNNSRLRLQTIVRLRWFAVAGQTIAVLICHFGLGFKLPLGYCLLLIAVSAWLNIYLRMRISGRHRLREFNAMVLLGYDIVQLAGLLFLTGGIDNPFIVLLVAPVTVSAATLPVRHTFVLGAAALCFAGLFIQYHLPLPWSPTMQRPVLPELYKLGQFAAILATTVFLALYVRRLASEARQMSTALSATELVLAREQRLHALDGLAAAAAHELGTPLATIALVAQELKRDLPANQVDNKELVEDLELLRTQAARCREILQKLTSAPSERDPMHARMTIRQIIDEASEPHRNGMIIVNIHPQGNENVVPQADDVVSLEPEGERQPGIIYGLGNLVENAVDYAASQVTLTAVWNDNSVSVSIVDDGPGFAPNVIDQLGEPYVRAHSAKQLRQGERSGLGLGFFIAKTLLERSGATLEFDNREAPDSGAIVRVSWPRQAFEGSAERD